MRQNFQLTSVIAAMLMLLASTSVFAQYQKSAINKNSYVEKLGQLENYDPEIFTRNTCISSIQYVASFEAGIHLHHKKVSDYGANTALFVGVHLDENLPVGIKDTLITVSGIRSTQLPFFGVDGHNQTRRIAAKGYDHGEPAGIHVNQPRQIYGIAQKQTISRKSTPVAEPAGQHVKNTRQISSYSAWSPVFVGVHLDEHQPSDIHITDGIKIAQIHTNQPRSVFGVNKFPRKISSKKSSHLKIAFIGGRNIPIATYQRHGCGCWDAPGMQQQALINEAYKYQDPENIGNLNRPSMDDIIMLKEFEAIYDQP